MDDIKSRIRILGIIMCIFNLLSLAFIDLNKDLTQQILFYGPTMILVFVVLYFFMKGRNWARICVIIGSILNLLFFFGSFFIYHGILKKTIMATETIFSVYLLLYLGKESIARFFKPVNELQPKPRNNILRILSIVVIISMALIGGCFLLIKHNLSSLVNGMEISLEDVQTGAVQRLTQDGWNFDPSFSADSNKIVFIHTVKNQQKESYELKMLSLNDKTVSTILREENTLNKPFLGPDLASIYFISGQNGQQDIWKMSLLDHKKVKITTDGQEKSNLILSPNGQWFAYIQNNELYLLSQDGKQKRRITTTTNFLYTPDCPAWSSDSKSIVYKSFTDLVVVVIDGNLQERISLAGLNNVSNIFYDTRDNDIIYFKARPAQEATLDTYLYSYSKKIGTVKLLHKSSLIEQGYNMSLNGKYFVFEKPWDDKSKKNN